MMVLLGDFKYDNFIRDVCLLSGSCYSSALMDLYIGNVGKVSECLKFQTKKIPDTIWLSGILRAVKSSVGIGLVYCLSSR